MTQDRNYGLQLGAATLGMLYTAAGLEVDHEYSQRRPIVRCEQPDLEHRASRAADASLTMETRVVELVLMAIVQYTWQQPTLALVAPGMSARVLVTGIGSIPTKRMSPLAN